MPLLLSLATNAAPFSVRFMPTRRLARQGSRISTRRADRLVESGGRSLFDEYWGAYFAILHNRRRDELYVVRDPTGAGGIYAGAVGGATFICTHVADYVAIAERPEPDIEFLRAFLVNPSPVSARTALAGVREILPGTRLVSPRDLLGERVDVCWRPTPRDEEYTPARFAEAASFLRRQVLDCAAAWARSYPIVAHRLSGGLDSSIVLAALREARSGEIVALNEFASFVPEGDERVFARLAAAHCGTRLVEVEISPDQMDFAKLADLEFEAKPSRAQLSFADDSAPVAIEALGANALVTTGQGGDQLFHRSHLPIIAADAWRDGLAFQDLGRVCMDTARLGRRPVWSVFRAIALHGVLRRRFSAQRLRAHADVFDTGAGIDAAAALAAAHPWASDMARSPPARALRMGQVAELYGYRQRDVFSAKFVVAPVLASQPIVEACLRIPPYVMVWGGRDRALARAAFADLIPVEVLQRSDKAATTRFHAQVLERQFGFMRDLLGGGTLVARGLINKDALNRTLSAGVVAHPVVSASLLTALLSELWLRRFAGVCADAARKREGARQREATKAETDGHRRDDRA